MVRKTVSVCVRILRTTALALLIAVCGTAGSTAWQTGTAQARPVTRSAATAAALPTLGLEQGVIAIETQGFILKLVRASQTVAMLQPRSTPGFSFTPADRLEARASNGYNHLGDICMRVRRSKSGGWSDFSSAAGRHPVIALPANGSVLAAADLTPTLPADCPLKVTRTWASENGSLILLFDLRNVVSEPVRLGALCLPMIFNNILSDRSLAQAHENCSFFDPYVGQDGGYLQVTRLNGHGPALLVLPLGNTPFEAYQPLSEPTRPNQTFEGSFAWMVHSQAYAETEWKRVNPWNPPSGVTFVPGETRRYGVKLVLANEIRDIEKTLMANNRPVAIGIPGYVLPMESHGHLFLHSSHKVKRIEVEPKGAISIEADRTASGGWTAYSLRGKAWGRARITVTYAGDEKQSIHYYVIKPAAEAVSDLGRFLFSKQWFVDPHDPFHRSPSVISYDREANRTVEQDSRVWIAGLGDEGGSGSWLAAAMKEFGKPDATEIAKFEEFVDQVLWGGIQYRTGHDQYGVRKSLFFYGPTDVPGFKYDRSLFWGSWTSWNKSASESIDRAYNYPHVVAAYWSLYRLARNHPGLVTHHPWAWYLDHAYQTVSFLTSSGTDGRPRVGYLNTGLMEGDIFVMLLSDLKREGWYKKADELEARMKKRTDRWSREAFPFGSEMAWDSTGQEEVYAWCRYFGYDEKARVSLDSILGYMPTLPHWGYNGNARRYWDFLYGGKLSRIERQIHHYGSGINAIPVLAEYRRHPDDFYLLRVGFGGTMGALSNIDQEGFASAAFHSFPSTLKWDAYSGDYGTGFFGHALNAATYVIHHPEFGWQSFGGDVTTRGDWVSVRPRDSFGMRVYVAPRGLWLTLDAGTFDRVEVETRTHIVRVGLSTASTFTPRALLRIEQPTHISGVGTYRPAGNLTSERGAFIVPLTTKTTWVVLSD